MTTDNTIAERITDLEAIIESADQRRQTLIEGADLAREAVNSSLRLFNADPSPKQQTAVDKAEARLAKSLKALHTGNAATDIARQDLVELRKQRQIEQAGRYKTKVAGHRDQLQLEKAGLIAELRPLILRFVEMYHFAEGVPADSQDIGKAINYSVVGGTAKK